MVKHSSSISRYIIFYTLFEVCSILLSVEISKIGQTTYWYLLTWGMLLPLISTTYRFKQISSTVPNLVRYWLAYRHCPDSKRYENLFNDADSAISCWDELSPSSSDLRPLVPWSISNCQRIYQRTPNIHHTISAQNHTLGAFLKSSPGNQSGRRSCHFY